MTLVAGRTVRLFDGADEFEAKLRSRSLKVLLGDHVQVGPDHMITEILPRRTTLMRTFGNQDREFAANVDLLIVVTAPERLFNTIAIDRALTIASAANVRTVLVQNKVDLSPEPGSDVYRSIGVEVFQLSAKFGNGLEELQKLLADDKIRSVVLLGVSGVGKSTLLNRLVPNAVAKTSTVSEKIGQGRQTTSQAIGYLMPRGALHSLIVIDLPGAQHLGVSHLSQEQVLASFDEFLPFAEKCRYSDCKHMAEPDCGVKRALDQQQIPQSRYASYIAMIEEIRDMPDSRKYRRSED